MAGILNRYADGSWLTPEFIARLTWTALGLSFASIALGLTTSSGGLDPFGRPLGTDFASFWTARRLASQGQAASAYDWGTLREAQRALLGTELFYPWSYPPIFLLPMEVFGRLPYLPALLVWQLATLLLAVLAFRSVLPSASALVAALSFPVVLICLGHGQTGFLSGALFLAGVLALPRREVFAGIFFGLLAYKPHLGLLVPIALAAGGYWRAFCSAGLTVALLVGATTAFWGWEIWDAFFRSFKETGTVVLDAGGPGFQKFQSIFAWLRLWGVPSAPAYEVQAVVTTAVAVSCAWIWRRPADLRLKGAALLTGTLLSIPYVLDYDMVILGMALALFVSHGIEHGFRPWAKTMVAVLWLLPAARWMLVAVIPVPVVFLLNATFFAMILREAWLADTSDRVSAGRLPEPLST